MQAGLDPPPYDHSLGASFTDFNGDGRPDLYVANDEDPNRLYLNEPGGPLGFHFVDDAQRGGGRRSRTPAWASRTPTTTATASRISSSRNSRRQTHAVYRARSGPRSPTCARRSRRLIGSSHRLGRLVGRPEQRRQARPRARERRDPRHEPREGRGPAAGRLRSATDGTFVDAGLLPRIAVNGRGLAAADYDNDGRVDIAVNTIGGKLLLLHNTGPAGTLARGGGASRSRRARVVTRRRPRRRDGRCARCRRASSYLSSEDPRVHFGLGERDTAVSR